MNGRGGRRPLQEVPDTIGGAIDIFVCSSSYEERCLSIPLQIPRKAIKCALILQNTDIHEVERNAERLFRHFGDIGRKVEVNTGDPIGSADTMYRRLSELISDQELERIAIDITTFTHEQLLILLGLLRRMRCPTVRCLYSGAAAYMTSTQRWLSEGIAETRSVLGFSGDLSIRSGSKLVVLVGFEWERARRLIEAYDPTSLALGLGRRVDAIEDEHYKANERFYAKLINYYPDATSFEFSCNDPLATSKVIATQCADYEFAAVVAPLNTKISTVGAALAAFDDPRIQLCYAQAAVYNCNSYSKPSRFFRAFDIGLSPPD